MTHVPPAPSAPPQPAPAAQAAQAAQATQPAPAAPGAGLAEALRQWLRAQTGEPVALIETHISWLLLAGGHAYKLKKPVRLPFVDFSTPAARRHFCLEELRLNRRFAPALYLDCRPVIGPPQSPTLGPALAEDEHATGGPEALDCVVRMRRFPAGALATERLAAGLLQAGDLRQLGAALARAHARAPQAGADSAWGSPAEVFGAVERVVAQLGDLAAAHGDTALQARVAALRAWTARQARRLRPAVLARQRQGRIRECHGDLHLANVVCLPEGAQPFDCLEFDPALRWIDPFADLAFATMDLRARGRPDLAAALLDAYLQESGDWPGLLVLRFYETYRALVRALVELLHQDGPEKTPAATPEPPNARNTPGSSDAPDAPGAAGAAGGAVDYLACAEALARAEDGRRAQARLLITHGLSGSGKSTLAQGLLQASGAVRLRSDVERKRLHGLDALQDSARSGLDIYTPEATRRTFDCLARGARLALRAGYPVIVDAAFLRASERQDFAALARRLNAAFTILDCQAPPDVLRQRVAARAARGQDASEAGLAVLERQLATHEPLAREEQAHVLAADTTLPLAPKTLARRWRSGPLASPG